MSIGQKVIYRGREYTVLGYAASNDELGLKLIEIAWSDYSLSATGYLAVARSQLRIVN